jgi:hypothetical protein
LENHFQALERDRQISNQQKVYLRMTREADAKQQRMKKEQEKAEDKKAEAKALKEMEISAHK